MSTNQELRETIKLQELGNGVTDGTALSWLFCYQATQSTVAPVVDREEMQILRDLARQVARLAELPVQEERKKLWSDHHSLKVTKPPIFIDPEYAWYELIPHTQLQCKNNLARLWEYRLRKEIFWQEQIGDDRVCTREFPVCHVFRRTGFGIDFQHTKSHKRDGAYHIDTVLSDWDDLGKLRHRDLIVDYETTDKILALAHETFDGILDVVIHNAWWYSDKLSEEAVFLRGFENFLCDFYEYPDELHALMAFLRDDHLRTLDFLEREKLLSLNNNGEFIGTGGYGWSDELPGADYDPAHVKLQNMWGYGESQVTIHVSPAMFNEFVLQYQIPILERFGLNFYGCCETLDDRLDYIKQAVPRLRTVSVSPWSDPEVMARQLRGDYVYCWKQNPARIAVANPDWDVIRQEIAKVFAITAEYGCPTEVLMRDVRTLAYSPTHAADWVRIVREEANKVYG